MPTQYKLLSFSSRDNTRIIDLIQITNYKPQHINHTSHAEMIQKMLVFVNFPIEILYFSPQTVSSPKFFIHDTAIYIFSYWQTTVAFVTAIVYNSMKSLKADTLKA